MPTISLESADQLASFCVLSTRVRCAYWYPEQNNNAWIIWLGLQTIFIHPASTTPTCFQYGRRGHRVQSMTAHQTFARADPDYPLLDLYEISKRDGIDADSKAAYTHPQPYDSNMQEKTWVKPKCGAVRLKVLIGENNCVVRVNVLTCTCLRICYQLVDPLVLL